METKENQFSKQNHKTSEPEPRRANGEFCLSTGRKTLHHLTLQQLKTFINQINDIRQHSNFPISPDQKNEEKIEIQKHTLWHAEEQTSTYFYNINSSCGEISMLPLSHLKQLSEILRQVIDEQETERTTFLFDLQAPFSGLKVWQSKTLKPSPTAFYANTCIHERTVYSSLSPFPQTEYMLSANEESSAWIKGEELIYLQQQLTCFVNAK